MASGCIAGEGHASPHHAVKLEPSEGVSARANWSSAPWPAGMKVLVVDDDPVCLKVVSQMLQKCNYKATTAVNGKSALEMLRRNPDKYDLVLSDVYMPDMDGFKLLEHVNFELNLPVIMMSSNGNTDVVLRGVTHGAVDFLIKPVRLEELTNAWQHVVRRKRERAAGRGDSSELEEDDAHQHSNNDRKRKNDDKRKSADGSDGENGGAKKARVVWSVEMHQQFVSAVNFLGVDKAVPKRILDVMNVAGLTRENVASHLQKYRLYLRKMNSSSGARGKVTSPDEVPQNSMHEALQFYHHQVTTSAAVEAQHPSPLGLPTYGVAPIPFPMGMPMQQHTAVMGTAPDQLVQMQMRSMQLRSMQLQAMSAVSSRPPGIPAGMYSHLGGVGLPMCIPGGTAITRGLEYGAAPLPMHMPVGDRAVPAGNAEGTSINDVTWLLSSQGPSPEGLGQLSSGHVTQCDNLVMESSPDMSTGSGDSGAAQVTFDKGPARGNIPCSSTQSSGMNAAVDGHMAMHGQLPRPTVADRQLYQGLIGGGGGSDNGTGAATDPIPGVEALPLGDSYEEGPPLGSNYEEDAAFGQVLLNPELFGEPLPAPNHQLRHATEEPSDCVRLPEPCQFPPLEAFTSEVPSLVPLPSDAQLCGEESLYSDGVPQEQLFPHNAFADVPHHQQARAQQHQKPPLQRPLPHHPHHQQGGQQPSCGRTALSGGTAAEYSHHQQHNQQQQQQQSMDDMLNYFLKDPEEE